MAFVNGRLDLAGDYFRKALEVRPGDYQLHYKLGRVFYEMVTGKECAQYPELLDSLEESIHPELRGLRKIILKCCEQMPEDRYPDACALARALDDLANPKSVTATPAVIIGGLVIIGILVYALYALLN